MNDKRQVGSGQDGFDNMVLNWRTRTHTPPRLHRRRPTPVSQPPRQTFYIPRLIGFAKNIYLNPHPPQTVLLIAVYKMSAGGGVAKRGWGGGLATAMAAGVCVRARAPIEDHVVETVLTRPDLTFVVHH